jgi:hypothetical protein
MNRTYRQQRMMTGRHFCLELLESRQLLAGVSGVDSSATQLFPGSSASVSPASVVATPALTTPNLSPADASNAAESIITTGPANGAVLTQSPSSLIVTFNKDVYFPWLDGDVQLEQVSSSGTATPLFDPINPPIASLDPTGYQATIPLSQTLAPGHYRIVLVGGSDVNYLVGTGLWDPNVDQTLADFTIIHPAPTLRNATDLGTVGTQVQTVSGSLDLAHGVANVDLYKVTLATGQEWQLGVELDAQRIGSELQGALTLFNQYGHVLATCDYGTGRPDYPADPYLFTDLNPGVYYIGVSGAGNLGLSRARNLAGQAGGYDLVAGTFGTHGQAQAGGAYNLQLVADAVVPTRVIGVGLQWGDQQGASPTGLVLAFSGSLDANSVKNLAYGQALWAVDQSGHIWNVSWDSYVGSKAEVGFVFNQPLPPGQYTLINSAGGIVDLGGQALIADGLPQGELATWTVPARTVPSDPGNLGVVWPSQPVDVSQPVMILPGQSTTSRVVIPANGLYKLQTSVSLGSLAIEHQGPGGLVVVDSGSQGPSSQYTLALSAGVYEFTFRAMGTQPVLVTWQLNLLKLDHDYVPDNGVGQSPALSLRLLDFTSTNLTTASPPGWLDPVPSDTSPAGPPAAAPAPAAAPTLGSSSDPAVALPQAPTVAAAPAPGVSPIYGNLLVTVNSELLGQPSSQAAAIGVVGPTVPGGLMVMADRSASLSPGIVGHWYGRLENTDGADAATNGDGRPDGFRSAAVNLAAAEGDAAADSADAVAISRSDRIVELGLRLGRWLSPAVITGTQEIPTDTPSALPELLAAIDAESVRGQELLKSDPSDRIDQADLAIPTGLIVVSAAAYRLRQFAGRWWRRRPNGSGFRATSKSRPAGNGTGCGLRTGIGPRPRSFLRCSATASTFVRAPHCR